MLNGPSRLGICNISSYLLSFYQRNSTVKLTSLMMLSFNATVISPNVYYLH